MGRDLKRVLKSFGYHAGTFTLGYLFRDSGLWLIVAVLWWVLAGIVLLFLDDSGIEK